MELEAEGGVAGRAARYQANHDTLIKGMRALGFREYLDPAIQSYIITTYYYPEHPNFDFKAFYERLSDKGFVIYPGKLGEANCFRIGNIGRLYREDLEHLVTAVGEVLQEMGVTL
jgi:2-aminoethylphosphonate-pyruvate transaminase